VEFCFLDEGNVNVMGEEEMVDLVGGVGDAVCVQLKNVEG